MDAREANAASVYGAEMLERRRLHRKGGPETYRVPWSLWSIPDLRVCMTGNYPLGLGRTAEKWAAHRTSAVPPARAERQKNMRDNQEIPEGSLELIKKLHQTHSDRL